MEVAEFVEIDERVVVMKVIVVMDMALLKVVVMAVAIEVDVR